MNQGLLCLVSVALFVGALLGVFLLTGRGEAKARARLDALTPDVWQEGLAALQAEPPSHPATTLLVARPTQQGPAPAKLGGLPLLPPGMAWPSGADGAPATHLVQLELPTPPLPAPWAGHRLSLFIDRGRPTARTEAPPLHRGPPAEAPAGTRLLTESPLWPLPAGDVGAAAEDGGPSPAVRDLERALFVWAERHGVPRERALARLLSPRATADVHRAGRSAAVRSGGTPDWVQDTAPAACASCGAARVLLLQVGDVFGPELHLGDSGVIYVLGCSGTPGHPVEAFLQLA